MPWSVAWCVKSFSGSILVASTGEDNSLESSVENAAAEEEDDDEEEDAEEGVDVVTLVRDLEAFVLLPLRCCC